MEAHSYRLALIAGDQPVNAGPILDDEAGGFPQRWLWLPTYDPGRLAPGKSPPEPEPWSWPVPAAPVEVADDGTITCPLRRAVAVPEVARLAVLAAREERERPIGTEPSGDPLDGHALLSRLEVAALLVLLDGCAEAFNEADWTAAGAVLAVSDRTRRAVARAVGAHEHREADRRALRSGRSAAVAADAAAETRTLRAMAVIRSGFGKHGGEHSASLSCVLLLARGHIAVRRGIRHVTGAHAAEVTGAAADPSPLKLNDRRARSSARSRCRRKRRLAGRDRTMSGEAVQPAAVNGDRNVLSRCPPGDSCTSHSRYTTDRAR